MFTTTTLQKALDELRDLPECMIARDKIDAKLAASEQTGGETPTDIFFIQLRAQLIG